MRKLNTGCLLFLSMVAVAWGSMVYDHDLTGEEALRGWWVTPGTTVRELPGSGVEVTAAPEAEGKFQGVIGTLPVASMRGSRVRISAEFKAVDLKPVGDTKTSGKFMVTLKTPSGYQYPQSNPVWGTYDWRKQSFDLLVPADCQSADVALGIERGTGRILIRRLQVELVDAFVDMGPFMNMGFADKVAGDGKGGWSDQGPDNDASAFKFKARTFAGVHFRVTDPAGNGGKSVVTFASKVFPGGVRALSASLGSRPVSGRYLYLLHTVTYGAQELVGTMVAEGRSGRRQAFEVQCGRDVNDWWLAKPGKNAHPASIWTNASGGIVGVFVSCFELSEELGDLRSLSFASAFNTPTWIVLGATVSTEKVEFPERTLSVTKADRVWRPFPWPKRKGIIPGTALDRGGESVVPVGTYGRVIVNKDGKFAFERRPDVPVRFFGNIFPRDFTMPTCAKHPVRYVTVSGEADQKSQIRGMLEASRRRGYNLYRMHFLDDSLFRYRGADVPAEVLDNFFYGIKCMRDNGIYMTLDIGSSPVGCYPGICWDSSTWRKDHQDAKRRLYFDMAGRENWKLGARTMLSRVNPYTGMRLVDDPVLACIIGFNEQEFVFSSSEPMPEAMPRWRQFLKEKYGTPEALSRAWGKGTHVRSFDDLPVFCGADMMLESPRGRDAYLFVRMMEHELFSFYRVALAELGWKGPLTNYNMGKSLHYVEMRKDMDYVAMNSYHAHPSNYITPGSVIDQSSSISTSANVARGFYAYQMPGKPYLITEYGHVFWNRFRYEQAFVTGGYAALNGIDGLGGLFTLDMMRATDPEGMKPFHGMMDPLMYASEFLSYYLFVRGDVKEATLRTRIVLDDQEVQRHYAYRWGVGSEQSRLALLGKLCVESTSDGKTAVPLHKDEMVLKRTGGSAVVMDKAGFSAMTEDKVPAFDLDRLLSTMKATGLLPKGNRSSMKDELYESSTGELLLDARRSFMSINTPRLQGICALAGTVHELADVTVHEMSRNGNLTVVSVDRSSGIRTSRRMVAVYLTDALNTGMVFDDESRRVLQKIGRAPVLCETGRFSVSVANANAVQVKAYALDFDGSRRCQLPVAVQDGRVRLTVDTAELVGGPALFFELVAE